MKYFLSVLLVILFISQPVFSQTTQKIIKVPFTWSVAKASKKINSTGRDIVGGKSRSVVAIILPANTVEWHYSFSTRKDGASEKNLQLGFQVAGILASVYTGGTFGVVFSGISKAAAQSISTPNGSAAINAYILDPGESTKFLNGDPFNYYVSSSMTNTTHSEMQTPYFGKDFLYLGFENTSGLSAVNVDFEIVAIVLENKLVTEQTKPTEQTEQPTYNSPNSSTFSKSEFVGTFRDENSTFTMDVKGNFFIRWDDGKTATGRWQLIGNKLNFDMRLGESNPYKRNDFYKIISWDGTNLKYQSMMNSAITYNAKKISQ